MICESCGENEATIHFTKIENGEMQEKHLCENCVKVNEKIDMGIQFKLNDLFGGLLGLDIGENIESTKKDVTCSRCGTSYKKILNTGKFGCSDCFVNFRDDIRPLLRSIHGHDEHNGKIPANTHKRLSKKRRLKELKQRLNLSIIEERYEDSAKLRDEIRELEKNIDKEKLDEEKKTNEG